MRKLLKISHSIMTTFKSKYHRCLATSITKIKIIEFHWKS